MTAWMCVLWIFWSDDTNVYGERNDYSQHGVIIRGCGQYSLALILKVAFETAVAVRAVSCGCRLCNRRLKSPSGLDTAPRVSYVLCSRSLYGTLPNCI